MALAYAFLSFADAVETEFSEEAQDFTLVYLAVRLLFLASTVILMAS